MNYQLAIVGGGPAGYTAAEMAARAGLSVVLFEKNAVGGVCLNEGCIPTKTLLYSAKLYSHFQSASKFGLTCSDYTFDLTKIISRKNKIIRKLNAGIRARLKDCGVMLVTGTASIADYSSAMVTISVGEEKYQAERLILATGSNTFVPPIPGLDTLTHYWTSREALSVTQIPERLLVVGGGVIGMEFAHFFHSLGSQVTVVEMLPEILAGFDQETARLFRETCVSRGITFYLSSSVKHLEEGIATVDTGDTVVPVSFDEILIAAGRRPSFDSIDLQLMPLHFDGKRIHVNEWMQTSLPNVYAVGDITGVSMLAHTAEREAAVAVHHILGIPDAMSYDAIPGVLYTSPEVACVGYTEEQLKKWELTYTVHRLPMSYAGRFVVENEGLNGFCKVLVSTENTVLGVHLIGSPSSEFIVAATMSIEQKLTLDEWKKTIFPHPTVSEILKEAIMAD